MVVGKREGWAKGGGGRMDGRTDGRTKNEGRKEERIESDKHKVHCC